MSMLRFNYRSQALGKYIDVTVTYPTEYLSYYDMSKGTRHHTVGDRQWDTYKPGMKFQTVYLIHGGGDDDSLTYRYTNAELFAQYNKVMLVTPDIANSFGVNTPYGIEHYTFLTEELPVVVQTLFASSPKREDNFIMGYAMGGNVALGTAIRRPDLYAACVDISGGIGLTVNTETLKKELADRKDFFPLYSASFAPPEELDGSQYDIQSALKEHLKNGVELPKFYIVAGSEEGRLKDRMEADANTMKALGVDVDFIVADGYPHHFELWNDYIKVALDQLLPLKRAFLYPDEN